MQQRSAIERIEVLERKVEVLERLPERVSAVELQLVQLRDEMRGEFSALRNEMRAGDEETQRLLREGDEETRRYMRILHEDVIARISMLDRPPRSRGKKDVE